MEKKLYRDEHRKMVGGVCAGLADYLGIDVTIVRIFFLLTLILKGGGGLVYIVLWIVLPKRDYTFSNPVVDYTVPPVVPPPADPFFNVPPQMPFPPKRRSNGALIGGLILITVGVIFLMDQLDIVPDWDFDRLWPIILVVVGLAFIFTGDKHEPWKKSAAEWNNKPGEQSTNPTDTNPPTEKL